ncbi:hypothetical protein Ae201684_003781 [Aphanomyces euteiches]|uniref:Replication factor A C-terminal domain-containing protein n=1 Tax=Aphanomyces euteiches TaxID=100861 RepID=A0A6G0XKW6_9STRA|nr:hypothetical protein Ae201684_003781 [Aphanomyces euteiches]
MAQVNFVPHAIIEEASVDSMLFVACPACRRAMHTRNETAQIVCSSCRTSVEPGKSSFSFKLVIRCSIGLSFIDAIIFNEGMLLHRFLSADAHSCVVVEAFLGCSANTYFELTQKWPSFPTHVAAILHGLHVSMTLKPPPSLSPSNSFKIPRSHPSKHSSVH